MEEDLIAKQGELIEKGGKELKVISPCTVGNGIVKLSEPEKAFHVKSFEKNFEDFTLTFFVPASGSGSRMFGFLSTYLLEGNQDSEVNRKLHKFLDALTVMPFYNLIEDEVKAKNYDLSSDADIKLIIKKLIDENELNLSALPKGLIPFHVYDDGEVLTPFEEHVLQNLEVLNGQSRLLNLHFTVQESFLEQIKSKINTLVANKSLRSTITYSTQSKNTDSIAFANGVPVKERGNYVRRPSGHGALLENIQNIDSDFIFLRNIDNVPHQDQSKRSLETKKVLAGFLMYKMEEIHAFLQQIEEGVADDFELKGWIRKNLKISDYPEKDEAFFEFAFDLLNRPIRVCGMVKNTGQPGGGPFWVELEKGKVSKQIVEKAQLNLENKEQRLLFEKSTHFNPVDIVCSIKDFKGDKFDLSQYVDEDQFFIVHKTHNGQAVQYIEKPGLWNGSMAYWTTFFIETSNASFCPVKTVNDLTSPQHLS